MGNSSVVISTSPVTRDKLARLLGGDQALIRLLESLIADVTVNIPTATDTLQVLGEDNDFSANLVQAVADEAMRRASQALEGPPASPLVFEIPDDLTARIAALEARLADAFRLIAELKEGPTA